MIDGVAGVALLPECLWCVLAEVVVLGRMEGEGTGRK